MPTNANAYNSRVTDEALEKRFRDTFRSQGGAELVDDLYAQGVIVPVVDFTAAATGQQLQQNLQTAWDFSTGSAQVVQITPQTIISTAGFWQIDLIYTGFDSDPATSLDATVDIYDGSTYKAVWAFTNAVGNQQSRFQAVLESQFVVFLRSGDSLTAQSQATSTPMNIWYRQIATVSGDLVNPTGFTSS